MKNTIKIHFLFLLSFFLIANFANAQQTFPVNGPHDDKPEYYALTNATVFVDAQTKLIKATLIIKDGKVESVGIGISVPNEAKIIDVKGHFIYPSFIDLYSNYGINWKNDLQARGQQFISNKKGAYNWNEAMRAELNAADYFNYDEKKSKNYLEAGFGATLSSVQDGICRGSAALVLVGNGRENELLLNARAAASMSFNKGTSSQDYPGSMMGTIALIRQTYYDAKWYKSQNKESNLSLEAFQALQSLPQIFEAENKLSVLRAYKIAAEFSSQYIIKGAGDEYQRINEIAATKTPLIIPVNFPKPNDVDDPFDANYVSLADLKHWELAPANPKFLSQAGIDFALTSSGCSDANEFLKNLRKAITYGLSEQAALKALTETPARFIKASQIGSLKRGMLANFFISTKNIFDKEAIITENWVAGKKYNINELPAFDARGVYKMDIKGYENYRLKIDGETNKLQVNILGNDTLKGTYQNQLNLITITFKENKKSENNIRLTIWPDKIESYGDTLQQVKTLVGQAQMSDASFQNFKAIWIESNKHKDKKVDSVPSISLGDIIFPFTDYGTKELAKAETVIFKNASIWTNESEGILSESDVAISNGKIVAIGKNISIKDAKIIDAKGKHLTNGIIDEHSHIAIYKGVNECTQALTSEVRIGDVINCDDVNIYRQLSGGVTSAQLLHGSCNPVGGQSGLIKLRWGLAPEKMKIEQADGFIKFALGENVKQSNAGDRSTSRYPQTRMGVEQVYYDAFIRAKEYEAKMKTNPALTRKDLELDALVEILNKKRFISCHSYVQSEINMLMHVADSMGFKVNTFTHILEGYKVADKMKAHGVCASTFADWWAYKYEVIEAIPYNAAIMIKAGVTVAINSDDAEMGRRLNQEAAKTIKYGNISEVEAWKMVTLNPAKMLHLDNRLGSIKVGKDADLVLWTDNPLSIYAKPAYTFVDGICYFSLEKDEILRIQIKQERQRIINKMMAAKQAGEKTEKKISAIDVDYHCED
jgi:imidazolonepropionase-like amidohydrolase